MSLTLSAQRLFARRVVVTAAGDGIGRAIAHRLHAEGARVAACDVDGAAVRSLADELPGVLPIVVDVANETAVGAMAAQVGEKFGGLDGLVNGAGVAVSFFRAAEYGSRVRCAAAGRVASL